MKRATWLAGEAWRRKYGQLATTEVVDTSERVLYQLPNGATGDLKDLVAHVVIDDPAKTLGLMRNALNELKDGECDVPDDQPSEQNKASFYPQRRAN